MLSTQKSLPECLRKLNTLGTKSGSPAKGGQAHTAREKRERVWDDRANGKAGDYLGAAEAKPPGMCTSNVNGTRGRKFFAISP